MGRKRLNHDPRLAPPSGFPWLIKLVIWPQGHVAKVGTPAGVAWVPVGLGSLPGESGGLSAKTVGILGISVGIFGISVGLLKILAGIFAKKREFLSNMLYSRIHKIMANSHSQSLRPACPKYKIKK